MKFLFLILLLFPIKIISKILYQTQNNESDCEPGYFGINCTEECDRNCRNEDKKCDKITGECNCTTNYYYYIPKKKCLPCPINCNDCYSDEKCVSCINKKNYGDFCNKTCDKCIEKDGSYCERNGKCIGDCEKGFKGDYCNEPCDDSCENCFKNGSCISCKDDYYLKDGKCEKCWEDCNKCNSSKCIDCKLKDKFGDYCNLSCSENCYNNKTNIVCDRNNGLCYECKENFIGNNCTNCTLGKTGINCDKNCPSNCNLTLKNCDKNGKCSSCIDGYKGEKCEDKCSDNCSKCDQYNNKCYECKKSFWGENCEEKCPKHCINQTCSKDKGKCECEKNFVQKEGCNECILNYTGEYCNDNCFVGCNLSKGNCDRYTKECICNKGYFLKDCSMECSENCLEKNCNNMTGYCFECINGFYGDFCNDKCPDNCKKCNRENGKCETCEDNYYLKEEKCIECSEDCLNKTCNNITGRCINCKNNDKYGDFCNKTCPINCVEDEMKGNCERTNGTCNKGCKGNFNGIYCNNCKEEYYNLTTCEEKCSEFCLEKKCNDTNGICNSCVESIPGRYGNFCEFECQNCTEQGCNRETGYCIRCDNNFYREGNICDKCPDNCESCSDGKCDNCKEGFKGEKCNLKCDPGCEDNCNRENGECNSCKIGYYGKYCNLTCNGCDERCFQENGECINHLCKDNYYNTNKCDKNCSENCSNKGCDLYSGECIICEKGKWGKKCNESCDDECNDNDDCCFIRSKKEKKSFKLDIKNNENDDYDFITLYIGKDSIPMNILVDYSTRSPLMIFDNQTNLEFYEIEEKDKIIIDKKYNRDLNKKENNSTYKFTKVKYSYMECDGFMINDSFKFNQNQNEQFNISFFIPKKIDLDDTVDLSSISISGVIGLNFLSIFTEFLFYNDIISRNIFLKTNNEFLFGDFSEEIKKDNFKTTTILKPELTNYKLNKKNEFYAKLSGFAVSNRKAYNYTLDKSIIFRMKGDSEIVLSTSFIIFFEKIYFNNYIKNNTCSLTDLNIKEFICKSINNLPKLGIIIQNYIYYLNTSFLFKKIGDHHKFIIKFDQNEQKMILGKDFFNQYQVVYNNGKQILNFYGDTKKVTHMLNNVPISKDTYDSYLSPGLKSIIIIYSIVGIIIFFYILKYCFSEDSDFEYDYDDDEDIDNIFEKE